MSSTNTAEVVAIDKNITPAAHEKAELAKKTLEESRDLKITNQSEFEKAALDLAEIKKKEKELTAERMAITKPMDESKKRVMEFFAKPLDFLGQAKKITERALVKYTEEQERIAAEQRAKAEEKARKERERLEARAEKAEENGQIEKAENLQMQANTVAAAAPAAEPPKVKGTSFRTTWFAECTDLKALCRAVAEGHAPESLVSFDTVNANRLAAALKDSMNYPGVVFKSKKSVASR